MWMYCIYRVNAQTKNKINFPNTRQQFCSSEGKRRNRGRKLTAFKEGENFWCIRHCLNFLLFIQQLWHFSKTVCSPSDACSCSFFFLLLQFLTLPPNWYQPRMLCRCSASERPLFDPRATQTSSTHNFYQLTDVSRTFRLHSVANEYLLEITMKSWYILK